MRVALSGTPGTGKSTLSPLLEPRGFKVCNINVLAESVGAMEEYDSERETWEVDLETLERSIPSEDPLILTGHLSHLLPVDLAIVLRCHPDVLRERLRERGWKPSKIRENVEAEALGVITQEALERVETFEIDTTAASPEKVVEAVLLITSGSGREYKAGKVDWSEVILSWF